MKCLPFFLWLIFLQVFFACTSPADKQYEKKDSTVTTSPGDTIGRGGDTPSPLPVQDSVNRNTGTNGGDMDPGTTGRVVNVSFADTSRRVVRGKLIANGPDLVYEFTTDRVSRLNAIVSPDKIGCNIRISRIMFPGGKSDGPFGKELKYDLSDKGKHQIIVGPNRMAGNPEDCEFTIRLILE